MRSPETPGITPLTVPVSINASTYAASFTGGTVQQEPAVYAWLDQDPLVSLQTYDIPDDGRVILASRVTDNGDGTWHYEYAVHNTNSDRSIGTFSVPADSGVTVSNLEFHDVDYHSGEPYGLTDWTPTVDGTFVSWACDPYATDTNANAIRWGTLYNFRFDADTPPEPGTITLGLFKPGTPTSINFTADVPGVGSGLPGPSGLVCSELNHDVSLDWTNGAAYDSITVDRDGVTIATLAGSATAFDDLDVPVGTYSYLVRGHAGGVDSGAGFCTVDVIGLPSPTTLSCTETGGDVTLGWSNPFPYTDILVRRDGTLLATLPGSTVSYTDLGLTNGLYNYSVAGADGSNESTPTECAIFVTGGPTSGNVLLWDPAPGGDGVETALLTNGMAVTRVTSLTGITLDAFGAVFVCLGIYPNNHVMSAVEGTQLADYLAMGGRVFCEGGDTWAYDADTAFHLASGVSGLLDGSGDLFDITGVDGGNGLDCTGVGTVAYTGANSWIDHLGPAGPDSAVVWQNAGNTDDIGVFYAPASGERVLGSSFQFEGLGSVANQAATMALVVEAFGLANPPAPITGLVCVETPTGADLSWTLGEPDYDNVEVMLGATQIALLPGSAVAYADTRGAGSHGYQVIGIRGGQQSSAAACTVEILPAAPTGLGCVGQVSGAALVWTLADDYDSLVVSRDGSTIATLAGTATGHVDTSAPAGLHSYGIHGVTDGLAGGDATCSATALPAAPTGLTCAVAGLADVDLSWSNGKGYTSVVVSRDGAPIATLVGTAVSYTDTSVTAGLHDYDVHGVAAGLDSAAAACAVDVPPAPPEVDFVRGEINGDGSVNVADVITLLVYLFETGAAPSCLDAADANDSAALDVADALYLLDAIFNGGLSPVAPFPACGADPTAGDGLSCQSTSCP